MMTINDLKPGQSAVIKKSAAKARSVSISLIWA